MTLSVILAFRDSSESQHRWASWNWLYSQYQEFLPGAQVVVGSDDGVDPFHKTLALNRAAEAATGDVLMIVDADTWCPSVQVRAAYAAIQADPASWYRPWNIKLKLGEQDTADLLARAKPWDGEVPLGADQPRRFESLNTYWAAPPHMFTRAQFKMAGGFDERFRGWGQEDEAFALSLRSLVGRPKMIRGYAIHLWHPRIGKTGKDLWEGETNPRANEKLVAEYRASVRYPDRMAKLVKSR